MPVISPHHTSSSYRSAFNNSLDRPSYYSSSFNPRISTFSERYTTRSYIDSDGRRTFSRSGSITEDGVTSRFKEEIRDGSARRESLSRDSIRENSVLDFSRRDRDGSLSRENGRLSSVDVLDDLADLRSKYSPSNYVPAIHRKNNENNSNAVSRSKSINDIGLPPIEKTKKKVTIPGNANNAATSVLPNQNSIIIATINTNNCDNICAISTTDQDDNNNGNRASVADLRKRFDNKSTANGGAHQETVVKQQAPRPAPKKQPGQAKFLAKRPGGATSSPPSTTTTKIPIAGVHRDSTTTESVKPNNIVVKRNVNGASAAVKKRTSDRQKIISDSNEAIIIIKNDNSNIKNKQQKSTETFEVSSDGSRRAEEAATPPLVVAATASDVTENGVGRARRREVVNGGDLQQRGAVEVEDVATSSAGKGMDDGGDKGRSVVQTVEVIYEEENEAGAATTTVDLLLDKSVSSSVKDQASSPKPSNKNNRLSPSSSAAASAGGISGALNTNSLGRKSVERERRSGTFDDEIFDRANNTVIGYRLGTGSPTAVGAASSVKTLGLNGLKNIGNTCFMNSVIQCLSNTKLLLEYLRQDAYAKDINHTISGMKGSLIKAFAEVIKELWAEDSCDRVVNTASLKGQIQRFAPRFMGYAQQDAQEFLRYLLEGLHEDVNRVTEKPAPIHTEIDDKLNDLEKSTESWNRYLRMDNSRIVDIFVGQLKSTLKCTFCGHCSVTFDPFWDLSLPIPTRTGQLRLSQCLESFTREETLDGDEKPTCSKCKERRKCTKSFSIQKFPKILVIHLKRFSPTERFRGKLNVTVDFPLEALDMSKYAAEGVASSRYNLYAVSNHSGTTYSGHYTAYCRHPYAMNWHEYNDSRVSSVSSRSIVSSEAYVLFYEQEGQRSHL